MSVWSIDALREYLDSQLDAIHKEITTRIAELHREHDKFERTVTDGFIKQNEFRGALEDLGKQMATRREIETLEESINTRLLTLGEVMSARFLRLENNQARIAGALLIVGVILPLVAALIFHLTTP